MTDQATASTQGEPHQDSSKKQAGSDGVKRAEVIEIYEQELENAQWHMRIIGSLHAISQFVAKCNLVFVSAVLLSKLVVQYSVFEDFGFVVFLLVYDAMRLSLAHFSAQLFNRALARLSQDPKRIKHSKDKHYLRARWVRNFFLGLPAVCLIFPGLAISFWGLISLIRRLKNYDSADAHKMQVAMLIFYGSFFVNSVVALVGLGWSAVATSIFLRRKFPAEQSILRYYDKLLDNAMASGVARADEFEFLSFAFETLAADFSRNVQPEAVAKNHKELIHYIYAHRTGVNFLLSYLNAQDAFLQVAAVNMVGFWADRAWGVGVPQLRLTEELLTKLADKVETGQVGWAATTSFGAIAASSSEGAQMVERTCTSKGVRLADRLTHLVDDSSSSSLSLVRTLVLIYEKMCEGKEKAPTAFGGRAQRCIG